ncbi:ABC transporter permease [Companilactobacillus musae]|uniref:ABC transporter permease n=1 Tax=Companilactobacillus musae TaxID=1903258 RepID=UPI000E64BABF|nr:ABC transporter permease [Companilactobacillus musae]
MVSSLNKEAYKLVHQKITWFAPLFVLILMIIMGILMNGSEQKLLIMTSYDSSEWILFALVVVSSTIFTLEFQDNTILTMLYKSDNKLQVYGSKLILVFIYNIVLHILAIIFTIVLQLTPLNVHLSWLMINQYQQTLLSNLLMTILVDIVSSTLIISIIFFTSCIVNLNAIVITLNLMIVFLGQSASSSLMIANLKYIDIIKWNPLNMINLTKQYYNYGSYHIVSHLSNSQLLIGNIFYSLLFFSLGYVIFKKKKF